MAYFKTSQYQIISAIVNRITYGIKEAEKTDLNAFHAKDRTWLMGHAIVESIVDELCIEFAKDNERFNETLFRAQCGNLISNQHAINDIEYKQG